jgi:acetylornithine deacetylase/succinyl-diaminopimelate desuccinylase-like protein
MADRAARVNAGGGVIEEHALEWCRRLILTPSVTTAGTRQIAELCARELLAPLGIEARLIPSRREGDSQVNLVAIVRGREPSARPLVLNTHLDTVPPGDRALWTECDRDPFAATVKEDRIYGLGAADTKLDFVAKAMALGEGKARRDVWLVGTFGEEHGLVGAKEIAESGALPRDAMAFVGEPSSLSVIIAHKGLMVFELVLKTPSPSPSPAKERERGYERGFPATEPERELKEGGGRAQRILFAGKAAHSSTPHLGRNAIVATLSFVAAHPNLDVFAIEGGDAVNKVPARCELVVARTPERMPSDARRLEDETEVPRQALAANLLMAAAKFAEALQNFANRRTPADPDFGAPAMTCNIGKISSGDDALRIQFEMRPPPGISLDSISEGVESIRSVLTRRFDGIEATLTELRANHGFRSGPESETVEIAMAALARVGLALKTGVKAGCTEAGVYSAAGLTPIVFGPGTSVGVIHAPNEYNLLSEVEAAIRFYRAVLEM